MGWGRGGRSLLRRRACQRGNAPSSSWNDSSSLHLPAASTSAAAIAGLLAGRQAEQEEVFDDGGLSKKADTASSKRKQSADLKRLLTQRRSLKLLLEDAVGGVERCARLLVLNLSRRLPRPSFDPRPTVSSSHFRSPPAIPFIEALAQCAQYVATGVIFAALAAMSASAACSVLRRECAPCCQSRTRRFTPTFSFPATTRLAVNGRCRLIAPHNDMRAPTCPFSPPSLPHHTRHDLCRAFHFGTVRPSPAARISGGVGAATPTGIWLVREEWGRNTLGRAHHSLPSWHQHMRRTG